MLFLNIIEMYAVLVRKELDKGARHAVLLPTPFNLNIKEMIRDLLQEGISIV